MWSDLDFADLDDLSSWDPKPRVNVEGVSASAPGAPQIPANGPSSEEGIPFGNLLAARPFSVEGRSLLSPAESALVVQPPADGMFTAHLERISPDSIARPPRGEAGVLQPRVELARPLLHAEAWAISPSAQDEHPVYMRPASLDVRVTSSPVEFIPAPPSPSTADVVSPMPLSQLIPPVVIARPFLEEPRVVLPPVDRPPPVVVRDLPAQAHIAVPPAFARPVAYLPAMPVELTSDADKALLLAEVINEATKVTGKAARFAQRSVLLLIVAVVADGRLGDENAVIRRIYEMPYIWMWPSANRARRVVAEAGCLEACCPVPGCDFDIKPQRDRDLVNHMKAMHRKEYKAFHCPDGSVDKVGLLRAGRATADARLDRQLAPVCSKSVRKVSNETAHAIAWAVTPEAAPYVDRVLAERAAGQRAACKRAAGKSASAGQRAAAAAPAFFTREVARIAFFDWRRRAMAVAASLGAAVAAGLPVF